ncbi:MAG: DUF3365 domain-containing protein [Thiobacillaceae bacterium]|nr:DUF3365 domain-containing protein [Thiobacillaceae bacterium]MDW8323678.1 DUF3365 domain-containing protein [Burkholderiales bacterium]
MQRVLTTAALLAAALPAWANQPANPTEMTEAARAMAGQMIRQLGGELQKQLAAGGPEAAISVCKDKAPAIAGELSRTSGWRVTRVSLKVRNPLLGSPDEWEQGALKILERRLAAGEKPETLEFAQIVDEPNGKVFRYMRGLVTAPLCLSCHGAPESIPDAVKARLTTEYPHDKATGYGAGMLRGGVSIKRPL